MVSAAEGVDYTVSYGTNVDPGAGAGSVTVSAAEGGNFAGSVTVYFDIGTKITFSDVDYANDWFAPAVTSAAERGLITGYADTGNFGPLDTLTRGQLATILWRDACPDEAAAYDESKAVNETGLDGISDHEYYTAAANWAVREGVVTGFERADGTFDFAADDAVSFEQMSPSSRACAPHPSRWPRRATTCRGSSTAARRAPGRARTSPGPRRRAWSTATITRTARARSPRARTSAAAAPPRCSCASSS